MKLTNKLDLPLPIVRAIQAQMEGYDKGRSDFSVTDLITPPQISYLREKHDFDLVEDVSQRIWLLLGTAIHEILAQGSGSNEIGEHRLFKAFDITADEHIIVSGKFDHLVLGTDNILTDYKVTSAYSVKGEVKPEWEKQLNYYRMLAEEKYGDVAKLQITAILRDWNHSNMMRDEDYPRQSVVTVDVPLWTDQRLIAEIYKDIHDHLNARAGNPRPCTDKERWHKPGKVALMKKGMKRAVKLFDTEDDLVTYMSRNLATSRDGHYMEHRPGAYRRCENYCPVADYCDQWKADQEESDD